MTVYVLQHEHELNDETTDVKLIGIYRSEAEALAARERLGTAPGFREHRDGFSIDAYELGQDHWIEGFDTTRSDGAGSETRAA